MEFLNQAKYERAAAVVANPDKFALESVERVALSRVDAKLSDEDKIAAVYKLLGGAFGSDEQEVEPAPKEKKSKDA